MEKATYVCDTVEGPDTNSGSVDMLPPQHLQAMRPQNTEFVIPLAMEAFALGLDTYADKIDDTIGRIEAVPDPLSEFEADRVVLRLKSHAKAIREIKTKHIDFIEAVLLKLEDEVEILKGPSSSFDRRLNLAGIILF